MMRHFRARVRWELRFGPVGSGRTAGGRAGNASLVVRFGAVALWHLCTYTCEQTVDLGCKANRNYPLVNGVWLRDGHRLRGLPLHIIVTQREYDGLWIGPQKGLWKGQLHHLHFL